MQVTIDQPALPPAIARPATIESAQTTKPSLVTSLAAVWREAWLACVAHTLPMLGFALIGLAGVSRIVTPKVDGALHELLTAFELKQHWPMIAEATVGTLALSFARGGISWLALHGEEATAGFAAACRAAFRRLPALLFGTLVYGAVITLGAVGLGLALRHVHIDVPLSVQIPYRYELDLQTYMFATSAAKSLVAQSASTLIPDPGAPFSTWLPELRTLVLLREVGSEVDPYDPYATTLPTGSYRFVSIFSPDTREFWWITAGSAALILMAEVLLRLRTVLVMSTDQPNLVTPLWHSLRLSIKHYSIIVTHVWLLRLCVFAFSLLFIIAPIAPIAPIALLQEIVLPKVMLAFPGSWLSVRPLTTQATLLCLGLASAIFTAFSVAYDARLYLHLAARADTVVAPQPISVPNTSRLRNPFAWHRAPDPKRSIPLTEIN